MFDCLQLDNLRCLQARDKIHSSVCRVCKQRGGVCYGCMLKRGNFIFGASWYQIFDIECSGHFKLI